MRYCLLMALLLIPTALGVGISLHAEEWTEFRGPTGQGLSTATGLPRHWSETENVAWKVRLPGSAWSSPVVAQDRIYLTAAIPQGEGDPPPHSLRALCLNAADGQVIWDQEVFEQEGGESIEVHKKNSHASPTPVIEGDRLYVHFGPHGTACLNADDGYVLWKTNELKYGPTHGSGGSPAISGDLLIICCDGHDEQYVVGLNKHTGEIAWKTPRNTEPARGFSFCTPLLLDANGQQQAICPGSDAVFAYEPQSGRELWRVRYEGGYSVVPRPVYGHGLVYVCTGFGDERLLAIDPSGAGDVTDTHVRWSIGRAVPRSPSLLLVGSELYFVDDKGIATCVDAPTGEVHWQQRLGGNFSASPLYAEGCVYFQDETGTATLIKAGTTFEEIATNHLGAEGERTFASYAVIDDGLLIRSENDLYRIEEPKKRDN